MHSAEPCLRAGSLQVGTREPGSLSHTFIPGQVPRTQHWPPRCSCSEEEFSWTVPRNTGQWGGPGLTVPELHISRHSNLYQCPLLKEASLTTLSQPAPPPSSPVPCFSLLGVSYPQLGFVQFLHSQISSTEEQSGMGGVFQGRHQGNL